MAARALVVLLLACLAAASAFSFDGPMQGVEGSMRRSLSGMHPAGVGKHPGAGHHTTGGHHGTGVGHHKTGGHHGTGVGHHKSGGHHPAGTGHHIKGSTPPKHSPGVGGHCNNDPSICQTQINSTEAACCSRTCYDLLSSSSNCGKCFNVCPFGQVCCLGACVDLKTNSTNCGACGKPCASGVSCSFGICGY